MGGQGESWTPMRGIGWTWDPAILAGLALGLYLYVIAALRFRARSVQVLEFLGGFALIFVALVSPLHRAADGYLFSLHVIQHMLLQMAAAPLLVLGLPTAALARLRRHPAARRVMRWAWSPVPAAVLYNGVLALWHLPLGVGGPRLACGIPTDLPLRFPWIAALQDVLPLGSGILFWGAVLLPLPFASGGRAMRLAVLGSTWVFNWLVSFVNALMGRPVYGTYFAAPRLFDLSPMADQMLGAGILWEHGNMLYVLAMVAHVRSLLRERDGADPSVNVVVSTPQAGPS